MSQKVEISHRTIVFTVFFLALCWLLIQIRQIILGFFIAMIIAAALNPLVDRLEKYHLPRALAALVIFILILGSLIFTLGLIISPLIDQTAVLISRLPTDLSYFPVLGIDVSSVFNQFVQLGSLPANLIKLTVGIFSNLVGILAIFVIAFYLLIERRNLDRYLLILFGDEKGAKSRLVVAKVEKKLGSWVRGQVVLMLIVGAFDFFGLKLLGVEFALPLAILGGLLEIMPNIGPTIATLPAILAGLTISVPHAAAAAGWYFLVQQLENSVLVPKVMEKATGVNPLITILALATGFKLSGVLGAILAVPIFLTFQVIMVEVFARKFPEA